jgi:uncharacterized protein
MRVVDSHVHVFPPEVGQRREHFCDLDRYFGALYGNPTAKLATVEDLIAEMDRSGVSVAVMCGFGWSSVELCSMQNDYVIDCLRRYPGRLVGLAALQPIDGEAAQVELQRCLAAGMKGVGELMPDGQGFRLSQTARLAPLLEAAVDLGFPVMTHCSEPLGHPYSGKGTATPGEIWELVKAFPKANLILAHWGGGYPFYELMPEVRAASSNLYYDSAASSYLYDTRVFQMMLQIVGPERLLWGSDYPVLGQRRFLSRIAELTLDEQARTALLGGNAARLLGMAE